MPQLRLQTLSIGVIGATPWGRYAIAIGAATLAVLARLGLDPVWGLRLPYITLFPAIVLSAWFGGLWPGIVTTVLCATAAEYFWIEPSHSWAIGNAADALGLVVFVAVGGLISVLNEQWRRGTIAVVDAGRRLAETEARTAGILDAALDGIVTMDHEGRVVDFNDAAERTFGYRRSEIVGLPMADVIIPPALRERHRLGLARYLATGEATVLDRRVEMSALRADGTELPVEISIARVRVAGPPLFTAHVRDISERQRAERERASLAEKERAARVELELVTSRTPLLLTRCTRDGRYVFVNRACADFFGRAAEDIIGKPIVEVLGGAAYATIAPYIARVLDDEPVDFEIEIPYAHAGRRFMRALYTPDRNDQGQVTGWIATVTDITERKRAENELRRTAALLEEANRSERAAKHEAELANDLKDQFLATVSHELRAPLNAVLGWAELLRSGVLDEPRRQRALEAVHANARRQAKLIEELLDVSRIVSGQLQVTRTAVDLHGVVRASLETVLPSAERKGIQIHTDVDRSIGPVLGDAARLQQVLLNLLTNAVKFTPDSGTVRLTVQRSDDIVDMIVSDTGTGIAPDFLPLVFEPFRQADGSTTRTHGGLGLGLAIVKHLAEAHGGTVSAHSDGEGRGATFSVRLPIAAASSRDSRPWDHAAAISGGEAAHHDRALVGIAVLVVEDDDDSRDVITVFLQAAGASVLTASSGAEALGILQRDRVDILLADIAMPGEDGYALIRNVRALSSPINAIPAAALTSFTGNGHRQRALDAGFQLHLGKPIESQPLVDAVVSLAFPMASP
jgi:PAS domain S-box-containing protein